MMNKHVLIKSQVVGFFLLLISNHAQALDVVGNSSVGYNEIEARLLTEEVVRIESFGEFLNKKAAQNSRPSHPMLLVTLKSGLRGVFKKKTKKNYHYAEVAAYRASKTLGLFVVPPTVYRTINGIEGSLQLYLEGPDLKNAAFKKKVFATLHPKTIRDSKIFTYVFGRLDPQGGNQLAVQAGDAYSLFLIDNSTIRHRAYSKYGGSVFKYKGQNVTKPSEQGTAFPYDTFHTITGDQVEAVFKSYMGKNSIKKFKKKKKISYVIWNQKLYIKSNSYRNARFTKAIDHSTLQALRTVTYDMLLQIWREYHTDFPQDADDVIKQELERRDQIVNYFEKPGALVHS